MPRVEAKHVSYCRRWCVFPSVVVLGVVVLGLVVTGIVHAIEGGREVLFKLGNHNPNTPTKITPSMVNLPHTSQSTRGIKPSKSASDLSKHNNIPQNLRKSTGDLALSTREHKKNKEIKNQDRKQRKLEKQKLVEQRKREKLAAREQEKQEKLEKEKFKRETQQKQQTQEKPPKKEKRKSPAPQPLVSQNPLSQTPVQYSSNTLESSISRSTGPPPYSKAPEVIPNQNDNTGNTSFGKPVDGPSSWDLVSQHRQQLNRPVAASSKNTKSTVLDLGYNLGNMRTSTKGKDNSEA